MFLLCGATNFLLVIKREKDYTIYEFLCAFHTFYGIFVFDFLMDLTRGERKTKGDMAMSFIEEIKARARQNIKTIVLPESEDRRTYEAAAKTLEEGNAEIIIIGKEDVIRNKSTGLDISRATLIDPEKYEKFDQYVDKLVELRRSKGMTPELARETMLADYTTFGVMMVKMGDADGLVSGACHSSANTLRPCLQILKTAPGTKLVSAFFLMIVPNCTLGEKGTFVFGDCGLNQNPTSEELAAIAESSAKSFELLVGKEAKIAMLSHSTKGSAKHEDIDKVTRAVEIAKHEFPGLKIDGELQLDAAIIPEVAAFKAPGSTVAGKANVLIFPDLDAGNIGYKLVERLGGAEAYGPLTQGIAAPVNDLSRGCDADDIVGVIAITAVQAAMY